MPDWSYHGLFRPLLFRLPAELARDVTLGAMGALCKLPGGSWVIRTMGHMELYPALETTRWGIRFQYPVGLGGGLDVHGAGGPRWRKSASGSSKSGRSRYRRRHRRRRNGWCAIWPKRRSCTRMLTPTMGWRLT